MRESQVLGRIGQGFASMQLRVPLARTRPSDNPNPKLGPPIGFVGSSISVPSIARKGRPVALKDLRLYQQAALSKGVPTLMLDTQLSEEFPLR